MPNSLLCLTLVGVVYQIGWLKSEKTWHITTATYLFSLSSTSKTHTHPQQPGTSSSHWPSVWSHTVLWDVIPFFNHHLSQVSQCGCVGHSGINSTPKLTPQVISGVERFHPLRSQILEAVLDKPHSVGTSVVNLEDRIRPILWRCRNAIVCTILSRYLHWDSLQWWQAMFFQWGNHHTPST